MDENVNVGCNTSPDNSKISFTEQNILHAELPEVKISAADLESTTKEHETPSSNLDEQESVTTGYKLSRLNIPDIQQPTPSATPSGLRTLSGDTSKEFQYQRLDPIREEIRLLQVKGFSPNGGLECDLRHVSLLDQPEYTALSYCWGNEPPSKRILLNPCQGKGYHFELRSNLYSALCQLHSSGETQLPLWVDAICINQADLVERADQVPRMRSIYQKAKGVVGWLGEFDAQNTATAINLMTLLATRRVGVGSNVLPSDVLHSLVETSMGANDWKSFETFIENEYWTRVWIIQEVAMGRYCRFYWGHWVIYWDYLRSAIWACRAYIDSHSSSSKSNRTSRSKSGSSSSRRHHKSPHSNSKREETVQHVERLLQKCDSIFSLDAFCSDVAASEPIDFIQALLRSSKSRATNPRDKAFSLLGLTYNGRDYIHLPNYAQPSDDFNLEISTTMMNKERSLRLLEYIGEYRQKLRRTLPSWSLDWLNLAPQSNLVTELGSRDVEASRAIYFRGQTIIQKYFEDRSSSQFYISGKTLHLQGKWIDTILDISKTMSECDQKDVKNDYGSGPLVIRPSSSSGSTSDSEEIPQRHGSPEDSSHSDFDSDSDAGHSFYSAKSSTLSPTTLPASSHEGNKITSQNMTSLQDAVAPTSVGTNADEAGQTSEKGPSNPYRTDEESIKALLQTFTVYGDINLKASIDTLTFGQYVDTRNMLSWDMRPRSHWLTSLNEFEFQGISFASWVTKYPQVFLNRYREQTNSSGLFTRRVRIWDIPITEKEGFADEILTNLDKILNRGPRLISTEDGYVGWGHQQARVGDMIWLLSNCSVPLILRASGDGFIIVGDVYLYGLMDGKSTDRLFDDQLDNIKIY